MFRSSFSCMMFIISRVVLPIYASVKQHPKLVTTQTIIYQDASLFYKSTRQDHPYNSPASSMSRITIPYILLVINCPACHGTPAMQHSQTAIYRHINDTVMFSPHAETHCSFLTETCTSGEKRSDY